ncbi:coiled-coil and C2 domain-containing protein 1A isoform X1 [Coregonus clupeaformis]|uniref:coiled-coil and C2 domain-containing protein 1A isoform X1 n=1 Tax=Coregonus clupeaformis TaxID=59861 RepID=UPI001E1C8403|nr:coiled-coil and C2 domain-containing protein 1A isoform X1 [Coregonus clupeaformis]
MSHSRNPPPRGQGAARAKQMGLLLDLSPDGGMDEGGNEKELEAELLALMGGDRSQGKRGKAPVPMADIERMAALCMKDLDDDDVGDEDLEDDDDLLAELNEVLEDNDDDEKVPATPPSSNSTPRSTPTTPSGTTGLEACLAERIDMYQTAISNAKAEGEMSKARRYDRGLKTLQSMMASAKKGKPINEEAIPPPVATGGKPAPAPVQQLEPIKERGPPTPVMTPSPFTNQKHLREAPHVAPPPKPRLLVPPQKNTAVTPDTPAISPLTPIQPDARHSELKQCVLNRQREYKLAALQAKQGGESELARQHYHIAKKLDPVVEALDRGEPVDLSSLPPPPGDAVVERSAPPPPQSSSRPSPAAPPAAPPVADSALPAPGSVGEALQQRMERYKAAAEGARSKGDDRKARMHQRIVKQYQDAIRSHKSGRPVNLADLPVPPGCPPLQGSESGQQNFMGVLETAMKLANQDADAEDEDGPGELAKPAVGAPVQKGKAPTPPTPGSGGNTTQGSRLGPKAQQQLDFLLLRRQAFIRAALRSKQMKDMQGAAVHLRHAKGLDQMISATKGGLPVDITKVPSAPVSEEDYSLSRSHSSPRSSEQYSSLMELLRQQHQKCLGYSQQFTHMGSVAETSRFEKLAEECMQNIEVLKKAHAKGQPVPKYHTEERTFNTVKMYPNLTANEMMLYIVKGINLPAPSGVSASDLDTSVRFEFPFPSAEEAQKDKTSTVKNSNSPEFKEQFKLNINRQHRGFKRVIQAKGIKFDIIHKGGLFKGDKVLGNAQLKLDSLENQCDIRQIIEVLDGRKATGGKLEVRVKIREPLGGAQLQTTTEKWLVLDPLPITTPDREREQQSPSLSSPQSPSPRSKPKSDHGRNKQPNQSSHSPAQYKLHSFSLLHYDKERLERQIGDYRKSRRDPPSDLLQQHKEVTHRLQWQKAQLERGSATLLSEYENVLQRFAQGLAESVKKFSSQGNRDAAKDALGRLKMVETELESLKRKRTV